MYESRAATPEVAAASTSTLATASSWAEERRWCGSSSGLPLQAWREGTRHCERGEVERARRCEGGAGPVTFRAAVPGARSGWCEASVGHGASSMQAWRAASAQGLGCAGGGVPQEAPPGGPSPPADGGHLGQRDERAAVNLAADGVKLVRRAPPHHGLPRGEGRSGQGAVSMRVEKRPAAAPRSGQGRRRSLAGLAGQSQRRR